MCKINRLNSECVCAGLIHGHACVHTCICMSICGYSDGIKSDLSEAGQLPEGLGRLSDPENVPHLMSQIRH